MIHRLTPLRSAFVLSLVLCSLGSNDSSAAEEAAKITFEDHVYPILDSKCLNCHNTDEAKGGLDLSSFGAAMTGGSGGEIVLSGDPKASRLYTLAAHLEEPLMPPKGTSATEAEMKVIADWITGGLLETKNSTAKKATKPKVDLNSITSTGKPDGPPAMPEHLILEPSLVTDRPNSVPALAHSPWAPILAVAGQKQILLYHSSDFDLLGVLPYPEGFPRTLSFSPNGAYLFCGGGRGGKSGNVVAWDIKTGERVIEVGKEFDIVLGADVSPDLKHAVMGGPSRNIKLWDTVAGEQISSTKKHTDWLLTAAYSPDGVIYATGDRSGGLYVWEAATGFEFYTLKGHTLAVRDLDWRMDGNVLASCSEDGSVILWEMTGGTQIKKWDAHPGGVQAVDFAPNGTIATVGRDKNLKIWKGDGTAIKTIPASDDVVLSVAFSEDSKRVFTGDVYGVIKGWNVESGAEIAQIDSNPPPIEQQLAYSEKRIGDLTTQLPKLEESLKAASAELIAAQNELAETDKKIATATQARDAQKAVVAKIDGTVKALTPQVATLQADTTAKNGLVKTITDALNAAAAALKTQQDTTVKLTTDLTAREAGLKTALAALDAAKVEASKPALTAEQKAQYDALAAAKASAEKEKQTASAPIAAKTKEQAEASASLEVARKLGVAAAGGTSQAKTAVATALTALNVATAAKQSAEAALASASVGGATPAAELVAAQKATADREATARTAHSGATATLAAAEANNLKAVGVIQQLEAKLKTAGTELASLNQILSAKSEVLSKADAALKPLIDAAAAGEARLKVLREDLTAKTAAFQLADKTAKEGKIALDASIAAVTAATAKNNEEKAKLPPAQAAATASSAALVAKQKELTGAQAQFATAQAEFQKAEALLAAAAKQKEAATAKIAAVVAKEAASKQSIEVAKAELHGSQFLQKKWQAAAINLTAKRETENLDDMAVKLGDMVEEETVAKKGAVEATQARAEAESTLATAKKAVAEGTKALQETSTTVLERALALVASRAVAELREGAIQEVTPTNPTLGRNTDGTSPAAVSIVAAETLSYKTPDQLNAEVRSLKDRLNELEQFLASTYVAATKTKSTIVTADQVAQKTPQVIAERTKAEVEAARELAEAETERKRQEQELVDQKKHIEELKAKYLSTLPKREG